MKGYRFARLGAAVFTACTVAACSGGGSGGGPNEATGKLTVTLTDAPVTDVGEIWLEVTGLSLKPQGDGPAIDFALDPPLKVDLLTLTPDNAATLLAGVEVPAGAYDWLAMDVNAAFDGTTDDSHVITTVGGTEELRVPSGRVRLVSGFTITADQATSFMIDWDTRQGLVHPPGQQGYMLRPAFRIVDMTAFGTLTGTVALATIQDAGCLADDANDVDVGNAVYVYAGKGVVPDDIDGADPEPVATLDVKQNAAGEYAFGAPLSPGDYTLAFTCQAGNDDPETDDTDADPNTADKVAFSAGTDVTITDGQESTAAF
ncbi:MAG TPA: DUF4382 domain-containing protein [Gammaproteobacteria bacterium]|nr:DUF4382 domain-containing protein [Gammaproteobacteria bacterium]